MRRLWALIIVLAGGLGAPGAARAQVPTVDPDGPPPAPPPSPPPPSASGAPQTPPPGGTVQTGPNNNIRIQLVPPEQPGKEGAQKPAEPEGMYLGGGRRTAPAERGRRGGGEIEVVPETRSGERWTGPVPDTHVVVRGDTLWDICAYYFSDPWRWPEIWAYNPQITNPHWIYPGNLVRLFGPGETGQGAGAQNGGGTGGGPGREQPTTQEAKPETAAPEPTPPPTGNVELRQIGFVTPGDLKESGKVAGSPEEKEMLSQGDPVYIDYASGKPPQVGTRYSIYAPTKKIIHPETKKEIGSFVVIRGDTSIQDVKKGKQAKGVINYVTSQGVIERGDRVGTLKTQFKAVKPVPAQKNVEGVIVGLLGSDVLIGQGQIVLIDRGQADGLVAGNSMSVVRRGDAYQKKLGPNNPAGMNDPQYPDRLIADVIVVDVGANLSVALVTRTDKEILVGDHVLMRAAR